MNVGWCDVFINKSFKVYLLVRGFTGITKHDQVLFHVTPK